MKPSAVRLLLIASAALLLAVAIGAALTSSSEGEAVATGQIYSTEDGDPIDAFAGPGDEPGTMCTNIGGFFYGSSVSCVTLDDVDRTGSYELVVPESKAKPPLVVGVLPLGASGAVARVDEASVSAQTRGRWFLVSLEPGSLGPNNANPVTVDFD